MKNILNIKKITFLIALSTTVTACSSAIPPSPETLQGSWKIQTIQDKELLDNSTAQLLFNEDNNLSGSGSCNRLSTSYNSQNNALTINPIATTRKMCLPALMEQETRLLQALSKVKRFQLNNGHLSMYDQQGILQIKAERTKASPTK